MKEENKNKPIIVYVEDDYKETERNDYRDALAYVLKNKCDCDVIIYKTEYRFGDDLEKITKYFQEGRIILIVVAQDGLYDRQNVLIRIVREKLSKDLPIIVLTNISHPNHYQGDVTNKVYVSIECLKKLFHLSFILSNKWYSTFSDKSIKKLQNIPSKKPSVYQEEYARIVKMSDHKRVKFWKNLRCVSDCHMTYCQNIQGFAIDPLTLEWIITKNEAEIYSAGKFLAYRLQNIDHIESIRKYIQIKDNSNIEKYQSRLITGVIFPCNKGFLTPCLFIANRERTEEEEKDLARIVKFLKKEENYILLTNFGYPL